MKLMIALLLALPILQLGCSEQQAAFTEGARNLRNADATTVQEERIEVVDESTVDNIIREDEASPYQDEESPVQSTELVQVETPLNYEKPTLSIILPSNQIRMNASKMQVTSKLSSQEAAPDVRYVLSGPNGQALGLISPSGLYTSPATGTMEFELTITSIWLNDETVRASAKLKLIPVSQIFVGCVKESVTFPITAEVFTLPVNTAALPNFSQIASSKIATVCMDQFAVATRAWTDGFPGLPNVFEWFALHTKAKLIVPVSGVYSFRLNSDDGSKMYIDKQLIINNDGTHSPIAVDATIQLAAGEHEIVLDYYQGPRTQVALELFWKTPEAANFVYVPKAAFK